jgi:hypothetical protein
MDYPCEIFEHHLGPCATFWVARSVTARDAWEADHPDWEKTSAFGDPLRDVAG